MEEAYLGDKNTKGEFFLKLENIIQQNVYYDDKPVGKKKK